ncbi:MAG: RagB/SusD family nutrient uptake outer membrane protein [Bacteroidetes bacterium]|nr:RagB/SusD family nutrient uptake outer membrane protein [Bacteroidota bacterium]
MKTNPAYFFLCISVLLGGCKKYLEKEPDNRAKLTDPKKVAQLLASAYPLGSYMAFNEAMSDNAGDKGAGTIDPTNRDPYYYDNVSNSDQDSPDNYWFACYNAIASANEALVACNNASNPSDYQSQKGEALVARAYAHFMLVTLYSKPYNTVSSSTDPGIPYVTEPETVVIKQYERKTVSYVYDMIEKDLLEGLPLLNDASYSIPRYHFNRSAANAFAARFYLYKKEYEKTVQYANSAIPSFLPNLRPWNTTYLGFGVNNLPAEYQKSTEPANLLLVTCVSLYNYGLNYATYRYALTPAIKDEILTTSIAVTGGAWALDLGTFVGSQKNPAIPKLNYTDFALANPTADYGLPYGTISLFTTEEVLFNKAEANTYLGNYDAAIADLNTYMSTRILNVTPGNLPANMSITQSKVRSHYSNTLNIQEALIRYILELKRAEFIHEGMRWFDILRYDIPVTHDFVGSGDVITGSITINPGDKLRLLKLPDQVKLSGINDLNR